MHLIYLFLALALSNTINSDYTSLNRKVYDVQSLEIDSIIYYTILPYKTKLDKEMNTVLCYSKQ